MNFVFLLAQTPILSPSVANGRSHSQSYCRGHTGDGFDMDEANPAIPLEEFVAKLVLPPT